MKTQNESRLRPHHILCERYGTFDLPERGPEFYSFQKRVTDILNNEDDAVIVVTEGPDDICSRCPECKNNRCEHPEGNEEQVRKWDRMVMKGLGIEYGQRYTVAELKRIIKEKAPLQFCKEKCRARGRCKVFDAKPA
jgi:hypothetical protein